CSSDLTECEGTLFSPTRAPRAALVLNGATGVPHHVYRHFAAWVARTYDAVVLTYDYRHFGASPKPDLKTSKATMADWAVRDPQAARKALITRAPNLRLYVMGHSLGGLALPSQTGLDRVEGVSLVASGPVHISDHPWWYLPTAAAFWYLVGPLATWAMGYLPGKGLGMGADLPSGVYWQWRRWCTGRAFYKPDLGHSVPWPAPPHLETDVQLVALADDEMVPPQAVWRLGAYYPHAQISQRLITPKSLGLSRIGHLRAFSPECENLWTHLVPPGLCSAQQMGKSVQML
ncbi:MAG: alpha/beta hydrolase, partial [Pseudomonadota bacterium]